MRYAVLIALFTLLLTQWAAAQQPDTAVLHRLHAQTKRLEKATGTILLGWGAANAITGIAVAANTSGSTKYFHQMNAGWGIVNAGLGVLVRINANKQLRAGDILKKQRQTENILMLNTGLDVAYIAGGWALKEKSKTATNKPERLRGFGESLMLQGGFLLAFDIVQYVLHRRQGRAMEAWLEGAVLQASGQGVSLYLPLR